MTNKGENVCICPRSCDCQNPDSGTGVDYVSNHCPVHNWVYGSLKPDPYPECTAKVHWWEEQNS